MYLITKVMNESTIFKKLSDYFSPTHLEVINESQKHQGHAQSPNSGNSAKNKERGQGRVRKC